MSFNFGIIFAVICIIGGLLMFILYKPFWWLMKKKEMPIITNGICVYREFCLSCLALALSP